MIFMALDAKLRHGSWATKLCELGEVGMLWKGRRESSNIEDRRGSGGGFDGSSGGGLGGLGGLGGGPRRGARVGGGSITFLIIAAIVLWFMGINPMVLLQGGNVDIGNILKPAATEDSSSQTALPPAGPSRDEMTSFVSVVLGSTEETWSTIFERAGERYEAPVLVLFSGSAQSACGFASAASGPFYCPGDRKLYIDLDFYEELRRKFKAPGDFAQAYVIAHEVGHHIQNLTGVLPEFNRQRGSMSEAEGLAMSVRVELQADCYAGVWGHYAQRKGMLEQGDLEEALVAATQIGDDAIQKRTQGYVVPESFSHGSSAQRKRWFATGFKAGDMQVCDTFNTDNL
jgi:uncharacterized protein